MGAGEEDFEGGADEEEEARRGGKPLRGPGCEEGYAYAAIIATMKVTLCN